MEAEVQKTRNLYYKVQNNLDKYEQQDGGGGITRYFDEEGNIVKISAKKAAYPSFAPSKLYSAEYYYEITDQGYCPRFVFVYGKNKEYRIYLTEDRSCVRYIDAEGEIHDYRNPISQSELAQITEIQGFCTNAEMEIVWAFGG